MIHESKLVLRRLFVDPRDSRNLRRNLKFGHLAKHPGAESTLYVRARVCMYVCVACAWARQSSSSFGSHSLAELHFPHILQETREGGRKGSERMKLTPQFHVSS